MAHEITIRENGKAEFAFTGSRNDIWHKLGSELRKNAPIEEWVAQAGLDWEIFESASMYQYIDPTGQLVNASFEGKKTLFRSDTKVPLSIVGSNFKVVQPIEVLEFFRELIDFNGMKLSAAGSLFRGTRFWATAEVGKETNIISDDGIKGYLLLTTSCDGTLATTAKFTSTRTICNNTLTIALNDKNNRLIKVSHKSAWDPKQVKIDLGLIDSSWDTFISNCRKLADAKITDKQAYNLIDELCLGDKNPEDVKWGHQKKVAELQHLYKNGQGSEYSVGSLWGILNAVTEYGTHGKTSKSVKDPSKTFWESNYGIAEQFKVTTYNQLLELVS